MIKTRTSSALVIATAVAGLISTPAGAHKLRERGQSVEVADSGIIVTPPRDWNRLSEKVGSRTETWSLDGAQLNDVTFYGGIESGKPLVREREKKKAPLPRFTDSTLIVEVPELLETTYRTYKQIATFDLLSSRPGKFLEHDGVVFTFKYADADQLTRKGEARAVIIDKRLYMVTFDAPQLHYHDQVIGEFRALADTARLQ